MRWVTLLLIAASSNAGAVTPVDIGTAATVYQDAAIRQQVRSSLVNMPTQVRRLFESETSAKLSDVQLTAVTEAAKRGFRIDVFEAPAPRCLAEGSVRPMRHSHGFFPACGA